MKRTKKPLSIKAPQSLITKLKSYSEEQLTDDERAMLNSIFGVYHYSINHKEEVFKDQPEFLKVVTNALAHMEKSIDPVANTTIKTA
jgi:hypothetical protein